MKTNTKKFSKNPVIHNIYKRPIRYFTEGDHLFSVLGYARQKKTPRVSGIQENSRILRGFYRDLKSFHVAHYITSSFLNLLFAINLFKEMFFFYEQV